MTVLKADQTAADRLLKAAVRRAVETYRSPGWDLWADDEDRAVVVAMLTAAGTAADLLLSERAS